MFSRLSKLQYKWLVAIVFIFGLFMDMLDSTAVNVAIPRLQQDFHAPLSTVEWTVTGYLLSLALFIPGAGFLSDRFGSKRVFLIAMGVFVGGSALCGQAHTIQELIAFRFVQGIGGGMMTPVSTAILSREFPGEERAKAAAIISVPVIFAPIAGPVFGGYLVQYTSWRWIFYINLPVGIIGFVLALKLLREHVEPYAQGRFDVVGLLTGGAGAAMVLYAMSEAANGTWTSPGVVVWGLCGLACLVFFCLFELRITSPVLDLRLYRHGLFAIGNAISVCSFASYQGFIFLLTLYLQELQGRSPLHAGFIQAPSSLVTAFSLAVAGRYYTRIGPRRMLTAGYFLATLIALPFGFLGMAAGALLIIALLAVRGLVTPFGGVAVQTIVYGPIENEKQGSASSIYNTMRQIASSFGVAIVATVQISRTNAHLHAAVASAHATTATSAMVNHANLLGYHDAFFASAALLLVAGLLALFVNDQKARDAMRKRIQEAHEAGAEEHVLTLVD